MTFDDKWNLNYLCAKAYYERNGHLLVLVDYKVKLDDNKTIDLGGWIHNMRNAKKGLGTVRLNKDRISLLNEIGMVWDVRMGSLTKLWLDMYIIAEEYFYYFGHLEVSKNYRVIKNGVIKNLGEWIYRQRLFYKKDLLNDEQIMLLNKI